jgi:hypothetical protein
MAPPSKFPAVMAQPRVLEGPPDISLVYFQQLKGSRKSQALAEMAHSRALVASAACSRCMKAALKHEFACCAINITAHPDGRCTNCAHFTGTGSCSFLSAAASGVTASPTPFALAEVVPNNHFQAGAASPVWGPASLEGGDEGDEKDEGDEGDEGNEGDWLEGERVLRKGVGAGAVGAGAVGAGAVGAGAVGAGAVGAGAVGAGAVGAGSEEGAVLGHTYREAEDEWL